MSRQQTGSGALHGSSVSQIKNESKKSKPTIKKHDNFPTTITEMGRHQEETVTTDKSHRVIERKTKPPVKKKMNRQQTEVLLPELNRRYQQPNDWNNKLMEAITNTKSFRVFSIQSER